MRRAAITLAVTGLALMSGAGAASAQQWDRTPGTEWQGRLDGDLDTFFSFDIDGTGRDREVARVSAVFEVRCSDGKSLMSLTMPGRIPIVAGQFSDMRRVTDESNQVDIIFRVSGLVDADQARGTYEIEARPRDRYCTAGRFDWSARRGDVVTNRDGQPFLTSDGAALAAPFDAAGGEPVRFGLRTERGAVTRVGRNRYELVLGGLHRRTVRLGDRAGPPGHGLATSRLLDTWKAHGFSAERPHALLAITSGKRRGVAHGVELGAPRVGANGRTVRFRVRDVDPASSPVPDVTRALAGGRFGGAILVIHDRHPLASGSSCGYVGQVDLFAAASQPSAYLDADGQQLAVADHTEIYALIGDRFGGDGSTHYNLPKVDAPRGLRYRFCESGAYPPRQPDGTEGRCRTGELSLQAQPFQPAGWAAAGISAPPDLTYYSCAGRQSPGPCIVGHLGLFASSTMPSAYLPADGRELRITSNQPLYFILHTTFGGDGVKTFALPDLPGPAPGTVFGVCSAGRWPS